MRHIALVALCYILAAGGSSHRLHISSDSGEKVMGLEKARFEVVAGRASICNDLSYLTNLYCVLIRLRQRTSGGRQGEDNGYSDG